MSLADAQTLAIRRLLSKSAYESNIAPGPPLPKSHPPPALLAKLHIECASLYYSARLLAKTPASSKSPSGKNFAVNSNKEVSADLRHYLANQATLHNALSHKWLGVDAGEKGGAEKGGEAVAFLQWAKKELDEIKDIGKLPSLGQSRKEEEERWKTTIKDELTTVNLFLIQYKKTNDTVCLSVLSQYQSTEFWTGALPTRPNATGFAIANTWRPHSDPRKTLLPSPSGLWTRVS
jgi:hypothetical protein